MLVRDIQNGMLMLTICKSYLQSNNQELIYTNNNAIQDGQIYVNLVFLMKIFKFPKILIYLSNKSITTIYWFTNSIIACIFFLR